MGQTVARAVERKGKRPNNPSWKGWIRKAGTLNKDWKNRYFCLEEGRLYYSKKPSKSSKGYIPLHDAVGMCLLHHRPTVEHNHEGHIPFVICTRERVWMLAFDNDIEKDSLINILISTSLIDLCDVILEDWVMFQKDSSSKRWKRNYLVYIGSGDILVFQDGSTTLLENRIRINSIFKIDDQVDSILGNNAMNSHHLSPRTQQEGKSLLIEYASQSIIIEFDTSSQCKRWKYVLVHAMEGDRRAQTYLKKKEQVNVRKKIMRQQRIEHARKQQHISNVRSKRLVERSTLNERLTTSSDTSKHSKTKKSKKKRKSNIEISSEDNKTNDIQQVEEDKEKGLSQMIDKMMYLEINEKEQVDLKLKSSSSSTLPNQLSKELILNQDEKERTFLDDKEIKCIQHKRKNNRRFLKDQDELSIRQHDPLDPLENYRKQRNIFSILRKHPLTSPRKEIPLIEMNFLNHPNQNNECSSEFEKKVTNGGFNELHDEMKNDFITIKNCLEKSKHSNHLIKQMKSCEHAIEALGNIVHSSASSHHYKKDTGDWYTKEPPGGKYVRHWIHRKGFVS